MTKPTTELELPSYETKRLIIRSLTREDVEFLFDHYRQKEIYRFMLVNFKSLDDAHDFFERHCEPGDPTKVRVGIELKTIHELIGTMSYLNWSKGNFSAEIGYSLSPMYWGQGLMTEALATFIKFGFEKMELNRIEATTNTKKNRSQNLLERLGFTKEGVLRQKYYFRGQFHTEVAYSLLREEWDIVQ